MKAERQNVTKQERARSSDRSKTPEDIERDAILRLITQYRTNIEDRRSKEVFANHAAIEGMYRLITALESDVQANKHRK
jgi:hypothetical protein